ncbi:MULTISPECIES: SRPBCC family protein [Streptomyces]|uniref:SRPBCC family protein n=2 Tax=Streptomyces TaxID=1883 RepID=A0ABV9IU33_9ACTN
MGRDATGSWSGRARYADKSTVEVHTWIAAPPAQVWTVVSDTELMPRLSPELDSVEWLDGRSGPAVGARFVSRSRRESLGEWNLNERVKPSAGPAG